MVGVGVVGPLFSGGLNLLLYLNFPIARTQLECQDNKMDFIL